MRRGRDQLHPGGGMACPGDLRVHLAPGQLPAFARLGPLGHLDLDLLCAGQIGAGHAEAPGRHLLDGAVFRVAVRKGQEARRVLPAFAGIAPAAQPVHRDGQALMRLPAEGAVGHGPGLEPADNVFDRFHLLNGDGLPRRKLKVQHPAQGRQALLVDLLGEGFIEAVIPFAAGPLQ